MAVVSTVLNAPFNALFWLVQWLPAEWQMVVLAVPGALFALAIYKAVSNQAAIRDAKDKIVAHLLELRLFRDDLRVLLKAEGRVFASIGRYLGHSMLPMVVDAAGLPADADPGRVALRVSRPGAGRASARHRRRNLRPTCLAHPGRICMPRTDCKSRRPRCAQTRAAKSIGECARSPPASTISKLTVGEEHADRIVKAEGPWAAR